MRHLCSRRSWAALLAGIGLVVLAGCGQAQVSAVSRAASDFQSAVAQQDADAACALLAPNTRTELEQSAKKPCTQALFEEQIPRTSGSGKVRAFGTMAQVHYGNDTVFLTRFGDVWKVMALACTAQPGEAPYRCQVKGG